jgi:hypothetical protein
VVDPVPRSIDPTPPSKSKYIAQVFLVTMDSSRQGGIPPFPMTPPTSNTITIDWNALTKPHLPFYIPFQIVFQVCGRNIPNTIIDEGASISILSSNAWQTLGSPQLALMTQICWLLTEWLVNL